MKQLLVPRIGPPEVLRVITAPDPEPRPGEVRIRVHAAGLNFSDLLARQGLYPDAPKPPCVVGYEVAGVIDAGGDGETAFRVGDRVLAMTQFGGHSSAVVVPQALLFPLPDGWSFAEGAAFPVVYLTAYHMLVRVAAAQRGESVVVHAAAGGVGLAVAEMGRVLGLRVIGLASAAKHGVLRDYGVEPIDGRDPQWDRAVRALAPRGVDIVLDASGENLRRGYELLAPVGRLIIYGVSGVSTGTRRNIVRVLARVLRLPRFGPLSLMNKNVSVAGVNIGHLWHHAELLRPQMEALLVLARAGKVRPRVDREFAVEEAAAAHHYIHARRNIGKVVLTFA